MSSRKQAGVDRRTFVVASTLGGLAILVPAAAATIPRKKIVNIATDDGRHVDVTFFRARGVRRGTILFSHGLRSAPKFYTRLFEPWSEAGYDVYAPLHLDSIDYPDYQRYRQEASWPARLHDMRAVAKFAAQDRFIAAGHSYGAMVALTLGGAATAVPPGFTLESMQDHRVIAALSLSPPGVIPGLISTDTYSTVTVPTLVQTGDRDSFVPEIPWQSHLLAYDKAPAGHRYSLVLEGVDHGFGGLIYDPIMFAFKDQRAQLDEAMRLSVLFLNAFGTGDAAALSELNRFAGQPGVAQLSQK